MEYNAAWERFKTALKDEIACEKYEQFLSRKNDYIANEVARIKQIEIDFSWHKNKDLVIPAKVRGYTK